VAWSLRFFTLPFLLPLLFFIPLAYDPVFLYALLIWGALNVITSILYIKAIKISPLSLTIPMLTFTPLFMLLTSPIILGEFPSIAGIIGICLIVFGSYLLNIQEVRKSLLAPFKALIKEKGPVLMLLVAFIWSITANIDKIAVLHSNPFFYAIVGNVFLSLALFPIMFLKSKQNLKQFPINIKALIPIGLFSALMFIFQLSAIMLTLVVYVIVIKRTSAIFSIFYGRFIFKEVNIKERLLGTIIMILGVLLISLF
ncbi:MAG: DMT family transporter, partial [Candidatus Aenigmarchaeota archaeon]|nr:DMT family transporter [Candidatus Aenigmarchaeota archaeon]